MGGNFEWPDMYRNFAIIAREEGFEDIAKLFEGVADIEKEQRRDPQAHRNLHKDEVFKTDSPSWHCRNCGHLHYGEEAHEVPCLRPPQGVFRVKARELLIIYIDNKTKSGEVSPLFYFSYK
jgi:rubrerythrin